MAPRIGGFAGHAASSSIKPWVCLLPRPGVPDAHEASRLIYHFPALGWGGRGGHAAAVRPTRRGRRAAARRRRAHLLGRGGRVCPAPARPRAGGVRLPRGRSAPGSRSRLTGSSVGRTTALMHPWGTAATGSWPGMPLATPNVPVFVVSSSVPPAWDGLERALGQAKAVAGDKDVGVGAASIVQQCIRAGLLDKIHIDPGARPARGRRLIVRPPRQRNDMRVMMMIQGDPEPGAPSPRR
jgi:hypothetical protein